MGIGGRIRGMIRNFLEIEEPQGTSVNIQSVADLETVNFRNKLWFNAEASALHQFYTQIDDLMGQNSFWAARPSLGLTIRKIHTGLPNLIVRTLATIVANDLDGVAVKNEETKEIWEEIKKENKFIKLVKEAVEKALYMGDGAFKISMDTDISTYPIIEFWGADRVEFEYKRGRLTTTIFKTKKIINKKDYILKEYYSKIGITYKLFNKDGKEVNIRDFPEFNKYQNIVNTAEFDMAVPLVIYKSSKFEGRGQSIFDTKIDSFDSFDESWSQYMDALRAGRVNTYIPDMLIPKDPNSGAPLKPNSFDNKYISTESDRRESGKNEIKTTQGIIQFEALLNAYTTALDLCLQGLISPSTLGIDVKKLDNAEAQREKEKATLYTRKNIVEVLTEVIPEIVNAVLKTYANYQENDVIDEEVEVKFKEYANPSFEAQVETISKASSTTIMSIETQVDQMWGDAKDEKWKKKEVKRIKEERGIAEMSEPVLSEDFVEVE